MNLISEDYLMHHGVKGMKWGVRHDPERKGSIRSGVSAGLTAAKMHYTQGYNPGRTSYQYTQKNKEAFALTDKQKKMAKRIAIGAAVVAGVGLATYGGVKLASIRSYNKASIAKFLDANPDIANSVLKGGKPYKNPVERVPQYLSGVGTKGSTISRGKITNSIKGPTLQTTRSTVTAYAPPNYAGINPPYVSKALERDAIGAKGRGRIMTKEQKKYYSKMYKDYIRSYKKR